MDSHIAENGVMPLVNRMALVVEAVCWLGGVSQVEGQPLVAVIECFVALDFTVLMDKRIRKRLIQAG